MATESGDEQDEWHSDSVSAGNVEETISVYICDICDTKMQSEEELANHTREHHGGSMTEEEKTDLLSKFSDEEILAKLAERGAAYVCVCGVIFKDKSLYFLHLGCHNNNNPQKCSFCGFAATDWYDFHTHFTTHKGDGMAPAPSMEGAAAMT